MNTHKLKCETQYYQAVEQRLKTFEVRRNDRNFEVFDWVYLVEVVGEVLTGRVIGPFRIIYILQGNQYGIEKGYCVMSIEKI